MRTRLREGPPQRRWAAAYVAHVAARTPADLGVLRSGQADSDPSVRTLVLLGLLRNGETAAIPRLISLLSSRSYLANGEPPEPLADAIDHRLTLVTRADFGFRSTDARARSRGIARWRGWWQRVRRTIRWDRNAREYRWPGRPARASAAARSAPIARAAAASDPLVLKQTYEIAFNTDISSAQRRAILRNFAAAVRFLNGPGRTGRCTPIRFEIEVRERGDAPTLGVWQLDVDETQSSNPNDPSYRTSYVNHQFQRGRLWTNQVTDPELGPRVIAHETAHTFGLPDEYVREANGRTTPTDPTSFLGDGRWGGMLQRHLDSLLEPSAACDRWLLEIPSWSSVIDAWREDSGSTVTHHLGVSARAKIAAPFWLDTTTGVITPAGRRQCGDLLLPGAQSRTGGRTTPCPDSSRNGQLTQAATNPGAGNCNHRFTSKRDQFDVTVTGAKSGEQLRLRLAVDDRERAFFHCSPAAGGGDERDFKLIANGMKWAGATDFTAALRGGQTDPRAFQKSEPRRRVTGTATARQEP